MKKFCETEASLAELRSAVRGLAKKKSDNTLGIIFGIACIIVLTAAIIFITLKLKAHKDFFFGDDDFEDDDFGDEYDDDFSDDFEDEDEDTTDCIDCDESGCRFASEKDFEK